MTQALHPFWLTCQSKLPKMDVIARSPPLDRLAITGHFCCLSALPLTDDLEFQRGAQTVRKRNLRRMSVNLSSFAGRKGKRAGCCRVEASKDLTRRDPCLCLALPARTPPFLGRRATQQLCLPRIAANLNPLRTTPFLLALI